MKNIFSKFDNDNSLDLLLRGNKVTESSHIVSFENSDDALDSLYEIYNESVNKFVEYKSAIYLENLVVNHMLYEKLDKERAEVLLNESTEVKINQLSENLNQTISNIQSWIATLEVSAKDDNEWNHCIETSKRLTDFINNGCENEELLLKVVKESLIGYKGIPWNKSVDDTNIIEKGDKIMKNERVSKIIATKEATLNELKVIAESAELVNEVNEMQQSITNLKVKIFDNDGEMTQESYEMLMDLDVLEEGLKEKMAAKMSGIKDKRVAKKIAKKEAQIEKIKAQIEKIKDFHKNTVEELEADIEYCNEKGDEKGKAKIEKKLAKEKENHAYDIEELEEDIRIIEGEIEKLRGKVKETDGEMTQEAYEILMELDVLEEGLKSKVKAIGDKRLNKKLAKRENLLGKMKQMLLDVEDEGHKEKIQSDILDLESDIEKIKGKLEKNIDEVVQESYLEVVFEHNGYDMIDEYDYLDEGLRQKIRGMKDDHLVKKVDKKEAKLAEKKIQLGEMETPEDDKKKAKVEKEIEKLEKEIERLKGKIKSEPGENIVEGEGTQESAEIDDEELSLEAYEIKRLEAQLEEMEAKIEAKQQVLNESYSYRTEIELEVLEEGLKEIKGKIEGVREKLADKCYNWVAKKYTSQTRIKYHLDELQATVEDAENLLKSREGEGKGAKIKRLAGNIATLIVCPPLLVVLKQIPTTLSSEKNLRTSIKYAKMEMAAFRKRLNELDSLGKGEEEAPAQENFSVQETAEIMALIESIIEYEAKIEAKQQVLNESYSYRTEIELEVLEEGLKGSINSLIEKVKKPVYDWICNKYNNNAGIAKAIDRLEDAMKNAKAAKNSTENANQLVAAVSVCPKVKGLVAGKALAAAGGVSALLVIAGVLLKLYKKRKAELAKGEEVKPEDKQEEAPAQEMFSVEEAAELSMMFDTLIEQEEKIEAKRQVLNENYSYKNDIEVEILEEGLKDLGVKIDNKINDAILKYKKPEALKRIIEREQDFIDEAKACLEERDQEKGVKKFFKVVGRSVVYGMLGNALTPRVSLGANPAKVIRKYIASAERFVAAANRRLAKLEGEGKQEEAPAQESTNYKSVFKDVLDTIDFED